MSTISLPETDNLLRYSSPASSIKTAHSHPAAATAAEDPDQIGRIASICGACQIIASAPWTGSMDRVTSVVPLHRRSRAMRSLSSPLFMVVWLSSARIGASVVWLEPFFFTQQSVSSQGPVRFEVILSLGLCGGVRPNTPRKAELMPRVASLRDIWASAGLHENLTVRNVGRGRSNGQKRLDSESSVGGLLFGSVITSLMSH